MSENKSTASGGAGFTSLLLVAFIVLKLCGVINWSWWWVLSPFWIPVSLIIIGFGIYFLYEWRKSVRINKRISSDLKKRYGIEPPKSKWQQRFEDMEKQRTKKSNYPE